MSDEFWDCIIDNRISIHVSGYKPTYNILDNIDLTLKGKGIPYTILKREKFFKYYTLKPVNNEIESYEKCIASGCYEVYRGKISTCSGIIAFDRFNDIFGCDYKIREGTDWIDLDDTNMDGYEIKRFLETPSYACKYCNCDMMQEFQWDYADKEKNIREHVILL
jgi:hypothetical protein